MTPDGILLFDRGNVDLPKALPFLGKTQLEVLSVVTSIFFMGTQGLTSASVSEKVLVREASGQVILVVNH